MISANPQQRWLPQSRASLVVLAQSWIAAPVRGCGLRRTATPTSNGLPCVAPVRARQHGRQVAGSHPRRMGMNLRSFRCCAASAVMMSPSYPTPPRRQLVTRPRIHWSRWTSALRHAARVRFSCASFARPCSPPPKEGVPQRSRVSQRDYASGAARTDDRSVIERAVRPGMASHRRRLSIHSSRSRISQ